MAEQRQLPNPPLREAVIDVRCLPPDGVTGESFAHVGRELGEGFEAEGQRILAFEGEIRINDGEAPVSVLPETTLRGYRYLAVDGTTVAQFRIDGFTFSKMAPYTDWDTVFPQALRLWELYLESAKPTGIPRLATRYINEMAFDAPFDLNDYFTAGPTVPDEATGEIQAFFSRVTSYDPDSRLTHHVTQAFEGFRPDGSAKIILDIDVFRVFEPPLEPADSATFESTFQALREAKNKIFFSYITDRAAEVFS